MSESPLSVIGATIQENVDGVKEVFKRQVFKENWPKGSVSGVIINQGEDGEADRLFVPREEEGQLNETFVALARGATQRDMDMITSYYALDRDDRIRKRGSGFREGSLPKQESMRNILRLVNPIIRTEASETKKNRATSVAIATRVGDKGQVVWAAAGPDCVVGLVRGGRFVDLMSQRAPLERDKVKPMGLDQEAATIAGELNLRPGDRLILATKELLSVSEPGIVSIVKKAEKPSKACNELISAFQKQEQGGKEGKKAAVLVMNR